MLDRRIEMQIQNEINALLAEVGNTVVIPADNRLYKATLFIASHAFILRDRHCSILIDIKLPDLMATVCRYFEEATFLSQMVKTTDSVVYVGNARIHLASPKPDEIRGRTISMLATTEERLPYFLDAGVDAAIKSSGGKLVLL